MKKDFDLACNAKDSNGVENILTLALIAEAKTPTMCFI